MEKVFRIIVLLAIISGVITHSISLLQLHAAHTADVCTQADCKDCNCDSQHQAVAMIADTFLQNTQPSSLLSPFHALPSPLRLPLERPPRGLS
jgi:hypothetical protein